MFEKPKVQGETKAEAEKGGGKRLVEEITGRTIDQMVARMVATGEIQKAQIVAGAQCHGSRQEAIQLMNEAKKAPKYMNEAEICDIQKRIENEGIKIKEAENGKIKKSYSEKLEKEELEFMKKELGITNEKHHQLDKET